MKNDKLEEILVSILQTTLAGKIKADSDINPVHIAKAMIAKVEFAKPFNNIENERVVNILSSTILSNKSDMDEELKTVKPDEKILGNFVRGKITAYEEILDALKNI